MNAEKNAHAWQAAMGEKQVLHSLEWGEVDMASRGLTSHASMDSTARMLVPSFMLQGNAETSEQLGRSS